MCLMLFLADQNYSILIESSFSQPKSFGSATAAHWERIINNCLVLKEKNKIDIPP